MHNPFKFFNILKLILTVIIITSTTFCQSDNNQTQSNIPREVKMGDILPLESIKRMVVNLREPTPKGDKVGTGTLIVFSERPFILTAKHVADDITINGKIVVMGEGDKPLVIPIKKLVANSKLEWKNHSEADIAIFEITPQDEQTSSILQQRFLPLEFFSKVKAAPSRDLFLTSIGFPLGLGIHEHFSPLTFESKASSGLLSLPRADTKTIQTFFALENPSVGGYSGCPVVDLSIFKAGSMATYGDGTCFYGVMHGTISDDTGGKIALVTPSYYVHELFNSL
jgi:hypothetical protein